MSSHLHARRRAIELLRYLRASALLRVLRWTNLVATSIGIAVVLAAAAHYWGFVQDDAFISLRYAQNVAAGHGLVFNPGERVEGITNLGWTLLAAALLKVHAPALGALRVLGVASAAATVLCVARQGTRADSRAFARVAAPVAALVLATSPTLQIWSVSGLEEATFALFALVALECAASGRVGVAAAAAAGSAILRPEGTVVVLALGVTILARSIGERRRPQRREIRALLFAGAPVIAVQIFRVAYYGEWVPNTFFVKGVVTAESVRLGVSELRSFASVGPHGALLLGGAVGLALHLARGRGDLRRRALGGALFAGIYFAHVIRVGGDVLPLYRLWLPLLPFGAIWTARAASWTAGALRARTRGPLNRALASYAFVFAALTATTLSLRSTYGDARYESFRAVHAALEASQGRIGRELSADAELLGRPVTVAAQDVGLMAAVAPSVRVVDVIGLVDSTVAKTLYRHDYTAFIRASLRETEGGRARVAQVDAELRDYVFSRDLDYVVVNVNCRALVTCRRMAERFDAAYFAPLARENPFYYEMTADPRFSERFELVAVRGYSAITYLLVYRAKELRSVARGRRR